VLVFGFLGEYVGAQYGIDTGLVALALLFEPALDIGIQTDVYGSDFSVSCFQPVLTRVFAYPPMKPHIIQAIHRSQ
jgi:hypothetical protein